ncbi:thioredoxin domain-containing protein [Caulobacter sp. BP25]|uniref:thioredoxin domain-containing protein n=1 Tax=Caulobacter sp. BP25 TaxID=2048900 RepID=UPI000C12BAC1|nr:thioredoxin domain-containing protein [Caulobacter sp. BP25]PHY18021.1 thiol:disulfide interchange protein [Caulobacter sp. BP25]
MTLDRRALLISGLAVTAAPAMARAAPLPPVPGEMTLGSPKAPVQFVAYASTSCPHCAHWWTQVLPQVRKSFVDTGKVRFVFREFLTQPTEFAAAGFILARRIPGKYFDVLTTVFQRQEEIYRSEKLWEGLLAIGKQYGLTDAEFAAAMNDPAALKAVNDRFFRALNQDNIEVTPTFFVNGAPIEGDTGFDALAKAFAVAAKG